MLSFLKKRQRKKTSTFMPVILVTGCSSGLGLELARMFYHCTGYRVVVTARPQSIAILKSHFEQNERFWILPLDVTDETDRQGVIQQIQYRWGDVNILINNAGICYRSVVEQMTEKDEQLQMDTNFFGPMALIRLVLPQMRKTGRGKIINVSSVSGMLAMPTMSSYSASKHALEGASEALWYEMQPFGVDVTLVQPGFINSSSFERVKTSLAAGDPEIRQGVYRDFYTHMAPFVKKLMRMSPSCPRAVALKILRVIRMENPPLWMPATPDALAFYYLRRLIPRQWLLRILFAALPNSRNWARAFSRARKYGFTGSRVEVQEKIQPLGRVA